MMREDRLKSGFELLKKDVKNSRYAILVIAAYLLFQIIAQNNVCPLFSFTGVPCPLCGMTRAAIALLQGHFKEAWNYHAFIYALPVLGVWFIIWRYILLKEIIVLKKYVITLFVFLLIYYMHRIIVSYKDGFYTIQAFDQFRTFF